MAYDKVIDSSALDAGMTATANAIRAKTGGSSPIAWDHENGFKAAVEGISTEGGVELPELGDTAAQPTDMAKGKVLYDDEGNPVTGTLGEVAEGVKVMGPFAKMIGTPGNTTFNVTATYASDYIGDNTKGAILRPGALLTPRSIPTNLFGDATADQVAKGATFTSAAGLLVEGALEEVEAGKAMSAREDAVARLNNDGTVQILAKTNFTFPGVIVRNGAYLRTTAPISAFDGIFGGVDVSVDGETLVITGDVTVENDTLIL